MKAAIVETIVQRTRQIMAALSAMFGLPKCIGAPQPQVPSYLLPSPMDPSRTTNTVGATRWLYVDHHPRQYHRVWLSDSGLVFLESDPGKVNIPASPWQPTHSYCTGCEAFDLSLRHFRGPSFQDAVHFEKCHWASASGLTVFDGCCQDMMQDRGVPCC